MTSDLLIVFFFFSHAINTFTGKHKLRPAETETPVMFFLLSKMVNVSVFQESC